MMSLCIREQDEAFMRRAIDVARGNPACPFGAVLVDIDTLQVLSEGLNRTQASPVRHGEIVIGAVLERECDDLVRVARR